MSARGPYTRPGASPGLIGQRLCEWAGLTNARGAEAVLSVITALAATEADTATATDTPWLTARDLAFRAHCSEGTVQNALTRLVDHGLVFTARHPDDARVWVYELTDEGEAFVDLYETMLAHGWVTIPASIDPGFMPGDREVV